MTKILDKAVATAQQMAAYLLSQNPNPKINMPVVDFCQLFLNEAAKEGVRGDGLFAQSCWETNDFKFTGTVSPDQNNYAGLGTLNADTKGAYFKDEAEGILAQAQHAKAYATTAALSGTCVDPRYHLLVKYGKCGTAEHWEELGGKWAVPGYSTKLYACLKDANDAKDSYGYKIIGILNDILAMPKESEVNIGMIGVNAGHTLKGPGYGAVGIIKESEHTRKVSVALSRYLSAAGINVKDCTIEAAASQNAYLAKVVALANGQELEWFISVHFNAGDGRGVEVYTYQGRQYQDAVEICENIAALGFKNRGVRAGSGLYVIRKTKAKSMLIEVCFVDTEDANQYLKVGADKIGQAIAAALLPIAYPSAQAPMAPVQPEKKKYVRVKVNELNVRKEPSWSSKAIAGTVRKREVFTVVDTITVGKTPMHKLKSGLYITAHPNYVDT